MNTRGLLAVLLAVGCSAPDPVAPAASIDPAAPDLRGLELVFVSRCDGFALWLVNLEDPHERLGIFGIFGTDSLRFAARREPRLVSWHELRVDGLSMQNGLAATDALGAARIEVTCTAARED